MQALPSSGELSSDGQGRGAKARRAATKAASAGSTVASAAPSPARNSPPSDPWSAAARFTATSSEESSAPGVNRCRKPA